MLKAISVLFTTLVIILAPSVSNGADFSADIVSTADGRQFSGRISVSGDKMRMDMPGATTITRMDKKVVWVVIPGQGIYMEQPFDSRNVAAVQEKIPGEVERVYLGEEMINDRIAKKYKVTYDAAGDRQAILQWIVAGIPVPVKVSGVDDSWSMEYKNINAGEQDRSNFELPSGCKKFSMEIPEQI